MLFRVHYTIDGEKKTTDLNADTPQDAAKTVRKQHAGAIVSKTKRVRGDN